MKKGCSCLIYCASCMCITSMDSVWRTHSVEQDVTSESKLRNKSDISDAIASDPFKSILYNYFCCDIYKTS